MNNLTLENMSLTPEMRAELELLMESKERLLEEMRLKPEVAEQFLKDIGLLDAEGNRVILPGEGPEVRNRRVPSNGGQQ